MLMLIAEFKICTWMKRNILQISNFDFHVKLSLEITDTLTKGGNFCQPKYFLIFSVPKKILKHNLRHRKNRKKKGHTTAASVNITDIPKSSTSKPNSDMYPKGRPEEPDCDAIYNPSRRKPEYSIHFNGKPEKPDSHMILYIVTSMVRWLSHLSILMLCTIFNYVEIFHHCQWTWRARNPHVKSALSPMSRERSLLFHTCCINLPWFHLKDHPFDSSYPLWQVRGDCETTAILSWIFAV